jgi:NAD+ diphosphatase
MPLDAFINTFAGNPLDRASERRRDRDWLKAKAEDPLSLAIVLWNGSPLVEADPPRSDEKGVRLAYIAAPMAAALSGGAERLLFMGLWKDTAVFAVDVEGAADPLAGLLAGLGVFEDLRGAALRLPGPEAGIAATAKAVFEWRRRHRYCATCGQPTEPVEGGWKRVCGSCGAEHFPRTDPVVIMLPYAGERCLLGRQAMWPKGMWSALAGFVEPGESLEEACARELKEEAALDTLKVTYHSAQPWPYPSSLMIGLLAEVVDGEAVADIEELEAVRWFSREEAVALMKGDIEGTFAPPRLAIAHQLIKAWAGV